MVELIDLVGNIALIDAKARSADVLRHVFEDFLGNFANFNFAETLCQLKSDLEAQLKAEELINNQIITNLYT